MNTDPTPATPPAEAPVDPMVKARQELDSGTNFAHTSHDTNPLNQRIIRDHLTQEQRDLLDRMHPRHYNAAMRNLRTQLKAADRKREAEAHEGKRDEAVSKRQAKLRRRAERAGHVTNEDQADG